VSRKLFKLHPILWKLADHGAPHQYYRVLAKDPERLFALDAATSHDKFKRQFKAILETQETLDDQGRYAPDSDDDYGTITGNDIGSPTDGGGGDLVIPVKIVLRPDLESDAVVSKTSSAKKIRGRAKKTKKKSNTHDFGPNPRLACIQIAAKYHVDKWNAVGEPLDLQLATGKEIHAKFGKDGVVPKECTGPHMQATLHSLGEGDAPCVIGITNGLSRAFLAMSHEKTNETAFALDSHSNANTSSIGAFFHCKSCTSFDHDGKPSLKKEGSSAGTFSRDFMGPHIQLGKSNSTYSQPADLFQMMKQNFAGEIINTILDTANLLMQPRFVPKAPPPSSGSLNKKGMDVIWCEHNLEDNKDELNRILQEWKENAEGSQPPIIPPDEKDLKAMDDTLKKQNHSNPDKDMKYFTRQVPNAVVFKGGPHATFSEHQDNQGPMVSDLMVDRSCAANGDVLPVQGDYPVVTFLPGVGTVPARLQWKRWGVTLATVDTDASDIHVQLPGTQDNGIKHLSMEIRTGTSTRTVKLRDDGADGIEAGSDGIEVDQSDSDDVTNDGNDNDGNARTPLAVDNTTVNARVIESYRQVSCPRCNPASYISGVEDDGLVGDATSCSKNPFKLYNRRNILTNNMTIDTGAEAAVNTDGTDDPQRLGKYSREPKTPLKRIQPSAVKFTKLSEAAMEDMMANPAKDVKTIKMPKPTVSLENRERKTIAGHFAVVKECLKHDGYFEIVNGDGEPVKDQPLHLKRDEKGNTFQYEPGRVYKIGEDIPFKVTKRSMTVVSPDTGSAVLCSKGYKNNMKSFKLAHNIAKMQHERDLSQNPARQEFIDAVRELEELNLIMHGFGGSAQPSDTHARTAASLRIDDATYKIGNYQSSENKETRLLTKCFDKKRVIAVFLAENKFAGKEKGYLRHSWQEKAPSANGNDEPMDDAEAKEEERDSDANNDMGGHEDQEGSGDDGDDDGGTDDDEDEGGASGEATFIGYMRPYTHHRQAYSQEDIDADFADTPRYQKDEAFNISYRNYETTNFRMKPLFTAEEMLEAWTLRKENKQKPLQKIQVWESDCRPMSATWEDLTDYLIKAHPQNACFVDEEGKSLLEDPKVGIPRLRIEHMHQYMFSSELKNHQDFKEYFEHVRDPNIGYVEKARLAKAFSPEQIPMILAPVSCAGAYRQQRNNVVCFNKDGIKVPEADPSVHSRHCSPLLQQGSDSLPDPLRKTNLPMPNPDLDVGVQACNHNFRSIIKAAKIEGMIAAAKDDDGQPVSYKNLDFSDPEQCLLLANLLLAATVFRFTGQLPLLQLWKGSKHNSDGVFLPTFDETMSFSRHLEACMLDCDPETTEKKDWKYMSYRHVQSGQHQKTIPPFKSRTVFLRFIATLGTMASNHGFQRVYNYIKSRGEEGKNLERQTLTEIMISCLSDCGNLQNHANLPFMVNKALLDVRCVIIDFIEDITSDQIHLGWGARQGLDCLDIKCTGRSIKERIDNLHETLLDILLDEDENLLLAMGCLRKDRGTELGGKAIDPYIVSVYGLRDFSLDDTEHFLCKIWLAIIHSHSSRNISQQKNQHSNHTWPLPSTMPWESHLSKLMEKMWDAFGNCKSKIKYPEKLQYHFNEKGSKRPRQDQTNTRQEGTGKKQKEANEGST